MSRQTIAPGGTAAAAAAQAFPWLGQRPPTPAFRRGTLEQAFAGSFPELLVAVAAVLSRHNEDASRVLIACPRVGEEEEVEAVVLQLELGPKQTAAELQASLPEAPLAGADVNAGVFVAVLGEANVGVGQLEPAQLDRLQGARAGADFDFVLDPGSGLLRCGFDSARAESAAARLLLDQIRQAVLEIAAQPQRALAELELLGAEERARLVAAAPPPPPPSHCIHEAIAAQAERRPDATAASFAAADLTYRMLDGLGNRLAHRLVEAGVARGDRVGIRLERSLELLVAILGVLKAGAAYVPIEPQLPLSRQRRIAELAGLEVLIGESSAEPLPGTRLLAVESLEAEPSASPPPVESEPDDVAYVLFTSGSTGTPKGVAIAHTQVLRLFAASNGHFDLSSADVWLNAHTFAFDASVWEIFGALLHGGRVAIASREVSRDPERMLELVAAEAVTMLTTSPTAFDGFRDAALDREEPLAALRFVVLCAEALNPAALIPWFDRWGEEQPRLVNMYGITETTVHSSFHRLRRAHARDSRRRIGRGLVDSPLYVLDSRQRPVPVGVRGEIYVGGPRVAAGYAFAGAEDQARFMPDPFRADAGARMYRSGDHGRWLADGALEYLGRRDDQVKIRGYRIELGEIEQALLADPAVGSARAWPIRHRGRPPTLAACAVPAGSHQVAAEELRRALTARLPDYMVPAELFVVEELPMTANGKLDLGRLSSPAPAARAADEAGPASPLESTVVAAMADVLGRRGIAPEASFFELGGDSITAVRLVGRLRREGLAVDLPQVYELRSAGALAAALKAGPGTASGEPRSFALLEEEERRRLPADLVDAYPTTRMQQALLFHNAVDGSAYHDVLSYTVAAALEERPFRRALGAVVAAHPALRTSFHLGDSRALQLVHRSAEVACEFVVGSEAGGAEAFVERWAAAERRAPFDWRTPGLLRLSVIVDPAGHSTLSVSVHHAILDGWSVALLVTELLLAYQRLRGGQRPLPAADAQLLGRHVVLEQEAEASPAQRRFWRDYVEGAEPAELADPIASEEGEEGDGGEARFEIPAEAVARLRQLAAAADVPLKSAYLAAHTALISYLCGSPDVLTGLVTSTRVEDEGGDRALGLFLNTAPFRLAPGECSWRQLLRQTFDGELAIARNRRYPFERIRAEAGIARLCPTGFNYTDFHVYRALEQAGIGLVATRYREKTDFQLLVTVAEEPGEGGGTTLTLSYDASVPRSRVDLYARLFVQFLRLAATPEEPALAALASWAEAAGLTWVPAPGSGAPAPVSPLQRLAELAAASPAAIAQEAAGARQSYGELATRVAAVAAALGELGVRRGERVACFLERGLDPLAALLGCWAAGASYVPVDVSLPPARRRAMLDLAGCAAALSSTGFERDRLGWDGPLSWLGPDPSPFSPPAWGVPAPEEEAYVLFTSGSTGEPKGIAMPHRSLANLVAWQLGQPELAAPRRISQFAALSFDVSVQEMAVTVASGGTLVAVPEEVRPDPQATLDLLARAEVEVAFLPVVGLQQLAGAWALVGQAPASLRWAIVAGEELIVDDSIRAFCAAAGTELVNHYGPTETHVVSHHRLAPPPSSWPQRPPIGLPVDGVSLRVLDQAGRPVPRGTPGELYIGGACVASGYLDGGAPKGLSGERFVRLPGAEGSFYRSGDLVRAGRDGLRFLGRGDDQVKIRGHRVEPSEVAAVLLRDPAVRSCAVRAHAGPAGGRRLVAYVVPAADGVDADELIATAARALPEYAVPSQVQLLAELPRTSSGKLDLRALPPPRRPRPATGAVKLTATERRVLELWGQTLGHPVASPTISFFEAGGDSLTTLRLFGLARRAFGEELAMHDLFRFPTARSFAAYLDRGNRIHSAAVDRPRLASRDQIEAAAVRNRTARGKLR